MTEQYMPPLYTLMKLQPSKPNIQRLFDVVNRHYAHVRRLDWRAPQSEMDMILANTKRELNELGIGEIFDWSDEK